MAVSVDKVYKTVLFILNKEQRGYVTPAEFNSIAEQVQFQIFESYFPDGNQQYRKNQQNAQNDTEFFDIFKDVSYKLYPFEKEIGFNFDTLADGFIQVGGDSIYKIGEVLSKYVNVNPSVTSITQLTSKSDFNKIVRSKLTTPNKENPLFYTTNLNNGLVLKVSPKPDTLTVNILRSLII